MIKDNFFSGLKTILPIVLFLIILGWVFGTLFYWIECIELLFPERMLNAVGLPDLVIKFLGLLLICVIIWIIGAISKQSRMSKKFKSWLEPLIQRIPLLSHLFKITNEVADKFGKSNSFNRVVLVQFPMAGTWTFGFVANENPKAIKKTLGKHYITVTVFASPPTSSFALFVDERKTKKTDYTVKEALSTVFSAGVAEANKESHSDLEWDFFIVWNWLFFLSRKI